MNFHHFLFDVSPIHIYIKGTQLSVMYPTHSDIVTFEGFILHTIVKDILQPLYYVS